MRALHWRRPTAAEAGEFGLLETDYPEPEVEVWPENWLPLQVYQSNATQWRAGMGGAYGLDYTVIFHELDRLDLDADDYDDMLAAIRIIEHAALGEMRKE